VQRLFSAFPAGWPGVGLLLLRSAAGGAVTMSAIAYLHAEAMTWAWAAGLLAIATGACLLGGFLTPLAGFAGTLGALGIALSLLPSPPGEAFAGSPASWLVAAMSATVALLGPGAYSVDARLFGRREVVIPVLRNDDGSES